MEKSIVVCDENGVVTIDGEPLSIEQSNKIKDILFYNYGILLSVDEEISFDKKNLQLMEVSNG